MIKTVIIAGIAALAPLAAQAADVRVGNLVLSQPYMRASMGQARNTAGYLGIQNTGKTPDQLVSASCACADMVMIHMTQISGTIASMKPMGGLDIPAGATATLAPGGTHLMVMGLKAPIKAGATVDVTLTFAKAGKVKVAFMAVDRPGAAMGSRMAPMPGMDHH